MVLLMRVAQLLPSTGEMNRVGRSNSLVYPPFSTAGGAKLDLYGAPIPPVLPPFWLKPVARGATDWIEHYQILNLYMTAAPRSSRSFNHTDPAHHANHRRVAVRSRRHDDLRHSLTALLWVPLERQGTARSGGRGVSASGEHRGAMAISAMAFPTANHPPPPPTTPSDR